MTTRHRAPVAAGVVAGMSWTAARVVVPLLAEVAINRGIVHGDLGALAQLGLAIVALGVFSAVCAGLRRYMAFKASYQVESELREAMFSNLQRLDFLFHDRAQTGQLMARSATDLQQINGLYTMVPISMASLLTVLVVSVVLLVIDWRLALVALFCLPFVNLAAKRFSSRVHPPSMQLQQELADLSTIVEETVTGIRAVKGFGAERAQQAQLGGQADRIFDRIVELARIRGLFQPLLDLIPAVSMAGVLFYGGTLVVEHRLTIGALAAFNLYIGMLINPLRSLGQVIAQAQRAVAAAERVGEVLSASPSVTNRKDAVALPPGPGEIRFEDITFRYGESGRPVLDGFVLRVAPGESVALVGATGSGKTTVARLVPRFYDVSQGRVLLDGTDVRDIRLRELRRSVAVVFEDTFLFTDTVAQNIAFAEPKATPERIMRAAQLAGAHDFISALPEGYQTLLGERGFSLSGGQRQRLALARAILADPRVLILDDATSSVDASKEHEIRDALTQVMAGRTTIVIAHRPATIALADRVVLLADGMIVAEGTHQSLSATNARYQEVLAQAAALDGGQVELPDHQGAVR
jgi:ATP-binding cassette subfamily B protein